ncbi:cation:proton antiporter [Thermococcus barophilus]|uniref:Na+/H+ antiporter n=2 Tax=Thermococcus barophilus TaxID=55802 RepID=A0A0S1XEC9_THEBA|nr:cation:proton antiporter [Thermococcus barophilus]ADT84924.1 Na+/H+ antiporter [Thermococcus barophilus MP]ALM76170.1 Na+/H+ antiporter [Thermococcus barophilus]
METLLMIAMMLATAKLLGWIFEKFGQPVVLGQILGGLIIGIFAESNEIIREFANLGVLLLLFLAGLESDLGEFKRVGKPSMFVAGVGVAVAFAFGFLVSLPFVELHEALLYGAIMTPTSVSITVRVLMELRRLRTKEGTTILAAAVVDDVLGILILTIVLSLLREGSVHYDAIIEILIEVAGFLAVFLYLGPVLAEKAFRKISRIDLPESTTTFAVIFLILFAYLAEHLNLASILGAYMVGLTIGQTNYRKQVENPVNTLGYSLFIPLFFVEVGMRIELTYILHAGLFAVIYASAAILSKILGCGFGAYLGGFDLKASLRIGVGMIPRLGVELAMLAIAMASGVVGADALTVAIFMVFVTTIITPPLLKWVYSRG